ncbi:MAG TPA: ABC transporter ATP-binding protein [Methylomirabilota bacterium]|nr:ABC transporter ATP-binding protein [Methylomirabilota bacterium]
MTAPPGAELELVAVSKTFGAVLAVDDVSLTVASGEFLTLLGPSGSGKTTTLMMIAGFESATAGEILLGGRRLTHVPPYRRNLGMVFQHYALFPHMTVYDNLAFPLRTRGVTRAETDRRVEEALARVRLPGYGARFPAQLSGGQQQRVALARALVYGPPVLLMDEPLGALDKKLREQMQLEIKHIQRELRLTVIYVTHDQEEALTMSDRIAVMRQGRIVQLGPPEDLYERPADQFVADFIGESNFLEVTVRGVEGGVATALTGDGLDLALAVGDAGADGTRLTLALRPERVRLAPAGGQARGPTSLDASAYRWWNGVIEEVVYIGATRKYQVRLGGQLLVAQQQAGADVPCFREGESVDVGWSMADLRVVHKH